jgi:hypothetical protein
MNVKRFTLSVFFVMNWLSIGAANRRADGNRQGCCGMRLQAAIILLV